MILALHMAECLLHVMMLKDDSYRTGKAESSMCECGDDEATVPHIILYCSRFVEASSDLSDTVEGIQCESKKVAPLKLFCGIFSPGESV